MTATTEAAADVFESKVVKVPFVWNGEKTRWKAWSLKMRGFIGGVSQKLLKMMKVAGKYTQAITTHEGWEEEQIRLDHKLYAILTSLVDGDALDVLETVDENFGLECWRQYVKEHEPKSEQPMDELKSSASEQAPMDKDAKEPAVEKLEGGSAEGCEPSPCFLPAARPRTAARSPV